MHRIDKLKKNISLLTQLVSLCCADKKVPLSEYMYEAFFRKLEEMKRDTEEIEKYLNFLDNTKRKS